MQKQKTGENHTMKESQDKFVFSNFVLHGNTSVVTPFEKTNKKNLTT